MDGLVTAFCAGYAARDGSKAAAFLAPALDDIGHLTKVYRSVHQSSVKNVCRDSGLQQLQQAGVIGKAEFDGWIALWIGYWAVLEQIVKLHDDSVRPRRDPDPSPVKVYNGWKEVCMLLSRHLSDGTFPHWMLPALYVGAKLLVHFGTEADRFVQSAAGPDPADGPEPAAAPAAEEDVSKDKYLEDAAWQLNRFFSVCVNDRNPVKESLKWGSYFMAGLLFRVYFRLNSLILTKNIIKTIDTANKHELPPLDRFPKSHQVTYLYYLGLTAFLNEKYDEAEESLNQAWKLCYPKSERNRELILQYLIPSRILSSAVVPSGSFLDSFPRIGALFRPFVAAVRAGDVAGFDGQLEQAEADLCRRRLYIAVDRMREIAVRNLFRKVYLAGGFEPVATTTTTTTTTTATAPTTAGDSNGKKVRRTRIPIEEFVAALRIGLSESRAELITRDDAECALANLIYREKIKGYIAREAGKVVLSKTDAFPGTGV